MTERPDSSVEEHAAANALADADVPFHRVLETDGPLAGSITALALITSNREALKPLLGHLKPWRA